MKFTISSLLLIIALSCSSSKKNTQSDNSKAALLKDYAMCKCLELGYKKDSIDLTKVDASLGVMFDLSEYSITLNDRSVLDSLTGKYVDQHIYHLLPPKHPGDYGGRSAVMLRCLEYFKSDELNKTIRSLHKKDN